MKDLTVKNVDFNGATITAAQDKESGKIYAGVKWVCDGIGLTEGQSKSERLRLQSDLVLSKGGRNFVLPTKGGKQEVLCIELDFLPLWLAKISITPNMQKEQPELTERLVKYQLEAKDVLADAFIRKSRPARAHSLTEVNTTIKLITGLCDRAGVAPQFQLVAAKSIYAAVGIDIPVEGVTVARQLYEPTEIARKLGIMSSSGNPHAQAVGAIIAKLPIEKGEREPVPFSAEHGHYGTHYQYTESVINKVVWWLEQHSYPAKIEHNRKNYAVTYTREKSAS